MSRSLLVAVALVALSSPSLVLANSDVVQADQTPAAPFQLNLARRFSSTVEQLKKRNGGQSKVSRAKERSISDELVALLKLAGAGQAYDASPSQHTAAAAAGGSKPSAAWDPSYQTHAASKPTGSRRPSNNNGQHALAGKPYKPNGPSAAWNTHAASPTDHPMKPKPKPSSAYTHAAAAPVHSSDSSSPSPSVVVEPSPAAAAKPSKSAAYQPGGGDHTMAAAQPGASAAEHIAKRAGGGGGVTIEQVQKRIQDEPWENLDSQLLCPAGETACPIFPRMGTYECVDTQSELENCGGCASRSLGEDCTMIKGALGLACQSGRCNVFTCQPGFKFSPEGRDGHGACVSTTASGGKRQGFFGTKLVK